MRILSLLLATLLIAIIGVSVNGSLGTRLGIENHPTADQDVNCEGIQMTRRDCSLRVLIKQETMHRRVLVPAPLTILFGGLYFIAGLGGGIVASWLRITGIRGPAKNWRVELVLLIVAGLAGIVVCVALLLPGVTSLSAWISRAENELEALRRLFGFALLAGIYTAGFFKKLEGAFLRFLPEDSQNDGL